MSQIVKNVGTDKIHSLFYQSHKEVDKIAEVNEFAGSQAIKHLLGANIFLKVET